MELFIIIVLLIWAYFRYFGPVIVCYKIEHPDAQKPTKAYHKAACFDVYSVEDVTIPQNQWREVSTGIAFASWPHIFIPLLNWTITPFGNIAGRILTRSGAARRKGLRAHLGIIDNDFRDIWTIIVFNHNQEYPVRIRKGDKVGQIEFYKVPSIWLVRSNKLSKSFRGRKKFGSSDN